MAEYDVKHHKVAAKERDWLIHTYGASLQEAYAVWMRGLANDAVTGRDDWSFDLFEAFEDVLEGELEPNPDNWARSLARFRQAGYREKLQALLSIAKKRRPPWQLKGASKVLPGLDGQVSLAVHITFEINDVKRLVVVRQVMHHAM